MEFEVYAVGIEGEQGIKLDYHFGPDFAAQALLSVTTYGGVKWYHQFDVLSSGVYNETRTITDRFGAPSDNFRKAIREYFDVFERAFIP